MSKEISKPDAERRAELLERLTHQVRLSQIASDKMDDVFCELSGLNHTDGRCLDLLDVHGGMTAGDLAAAASLSPAATTTVLDRLEGAGLVTRTRDQQDRRRVLVEVTEEARTQAWDAYGPMAGYAAEYLERLPLEELEVILGFLEVATEVNERRAAELRGRGEDAAPGRASAQS